MMTKKSEEMSKCFDDINKYSGVIFSRSRRSALITLIGISRTRTSASNTLFRRPKTKTNQHLAARQLQDQQRRLAVKAGVTKDKKNHVRKKDAAPDEKFGDNLSDQTSQTSFGDKESAGPS